MKTRLRSYILPLIICTALTSSCEQYLTLDSPSGVSDAQWWNTETDARNALAQVYAGIPGGSSGRNIMYYAGLSDEAVHRADFKGDYDTYTRGLANSRWGVSASLWQDDYTCIRRANRYLENVDRTFMDAGLREQYKYEARALRAYYHMELLMLYGDIPLLTLSLAAEETNQPRNSADEVYAFVVSELQECAQHLPLKPIVIQENWRITSGVCWALLTRLGMFKQDYELVQRAAKAVIDSKVYKLWISASNKTASYSELFGYTGQLNDERIFFKEKGCATAWVNFAPAGLGGETYLSPTNTVVNNYETKQGRTPEELGRDSLLIYQRDPNFKNNRDPRLAASIFIPNEVFQGHKLDPFYSPSDRIGETKSTATGYWIKKYVDARDRQAKGGSLDFMIIRYAEILLSYAEALIESGQWNSAEAINAINEVRARATMPPVNTGIYNSQTKMRELIRRERQAELSFEGGRYFDIRRWGIDSEVMNGDVYGATNPTTGELVRVQSRQYRRDREELWPIPDAEMVANPNMKQNPNY